MQFETIMRRARCLNRSQTNEATNAMIDMDNKVARYKCSHFRQEILSAAGFLALAHKPVAQNILLANDDEITGFKSLLKTDHGKRIFAFGQRQSLIESGNQFTACQTMISQNTGEALARAIGPRIEVP
jgi:hypothetical protein